MKPEIILSVVYICFAFLLLTITLVVAKFRRVFCYYLYAMGLLAAGITLYLAGGGYYFCGSIMFWIMITFFIGGFIIDVFNSLISKSVDRK
jgi:hypothetical protein